MHGVQCRDATAVSVELSADPVLLRVRCFAGAHTPPFGGVAAKRPDTREPREAGRVVARERVLLGVGNVDVGLAQHQVEQLPRCHLFLASQQDEAVPRQRGADNSSSPWVLRWKGVQLDAEMRV